MGYTIDAWIEYDDRADYDPKGAAGKPPFSEPTEGCIPLEDFFEFRYSKDYRFFAAISGIMRDESDPEPLFSLRGSLPPNVSEQAKRLISKTTSLEYPSIGWLAYAEIEKAMAHMKVRPDDLSLASNLVLDLMRSIEKRLGDGHSRLIFFLEY